MLARIPIRYVTSSFGIVLVAAATVYFGGNPLQLMVGGIALGMAIALTITQSKKLPVNATLGDL
jgi:membrane-associated phospholipid phosphatase